MFEQKIIKNMITPELQHTIREVAYAILLLDIGFLAGYLTKVFMINYENMKKSKKSDESSSSDKS